MSLLSPIRLSPLMQKRVRQFMRMRRARYSLIGLAGLFILSLCSELLCNSRPLYLRVEGRHYLPFVQALTLHELIGEEADSTRVNYHEFVASPTFSSNPANRVVWAPVAFSPGDVVNASALSRYRSVQVSLVPEVHVGRINLLPDQRVIRAEGCEPFFPGVSQINGERLEQHWQIPDVLRATLDARLTGKAVGEEHFVLTHAVQTNLQARVTLPAVSAGTRQTIWPRMMFRQLAEPELPIQLRFRQTEKGVPYPITQSAWERVPEAARPAIIEQVVATFAGHSSTRQIAWKTRHAEVISGLTEVSWPFQPVRGHWMGIDAAGRDVLARVLYGMRIAMIFGILLAVWAMFLGVIIGAIQGFLGGWVDILGQRFTEIWSALPFLYVMIFIGASLGRSFWLLLICYSLFNWIGISYYMRAEFLRLRSRTFVDAARCQGLSTLRIIFSHILPNALTPLITLFPFSLIGAIGSLAALDFLGFGLPPLTPSWGELLQQAQQFRWAWWLILFPSLALFTVMLLAVLIGEGLRDAFDPRQQMKLE